MRLGQQRGTLSMWKDKQGYGFITPHDAGAEVFIHISAFKERQRRPCVGDMVGYDILKQDGKQRACNAFIVTAHARRSPRVTLSKRLLWTVVPWCLFPVGCAGYLAIQQHTLIAVVGYIVLSLLTFYAYADDKRRARSRRWRISETTLHTLEIMGGWPGALVAQHTLRHKTKKRSYQVTFWSIVGSHYAGWLLWLGWYVQL